MVGGSYDVCCPGKSLDIGGVINCCVGGYGNDDKRDICIGDARHCQSDNDKTSSCVTAVPATAGDFSDRVSRATATMTGRPLATGSDNAAGVVAAATWKTVGGVVGGTLASLVLFS